MIRYQYQTQLTPPAPFVNVVLRSPVTAVEVRDVPAQLDCAADRTVLPSSIVEALQLPQVGILPLGAFGGATYTLPTYAIMLGIHDLPARLFKVAAHVDEPWILLGRDVINAYRLFLDGPQLALEIHP